MGGCEATANNTSEGRQTGHLHMYGSQMTHGRGVDAGRTACLHLLPLPSARNSLGQPCFSCLGRSRHSVLNQNTARSLPVSIGRVGPTQPNRRCSRPAQPPLRCELGRAHTAAVTACSRSLRASMVALVRDQVNMMCRTWQGQATKSRSAALRGLQRLSAVGVRDVSEARGHTCTSCNSASSAGGAVATAAQQYVHVTLTPVSVGRMTGLSAAAFRTSVLRSNSVKVAAACWQALRFRVAKNPTHPQAH